MDKTLLTAFIIIAVVAIAALLFLGASGSLHTGSSNESDKNVAGDARKIDVNTKTGLCGNSGSPFISTSC